MSFLLSSAVRSSRRIVGTTLLVLLVLSPIRSCLAAEATFGPADNHSLQLPAGWTGKRDEDKAVIGEAPGGVLFNANVYDSNQSPEDYMEGVIGVAANKAGYKLIEKGSVQSRSGRKAQLVRYQLDGPKGPQIYVQYVFQLVENQIVVLGFAFLSEVPKSAKNDVEAIFDSVKLVTGAGQDDSWLTTPAEKPKKDSKLPRDADSETPSKKPDAADDDDATEWPCALPPGVTAAAKKVKLAAPKTIPGTRVSISFPRGWTNYKTNPSDNTTFLAQNNPGQTMVIAVYGSTHDSVEEYTENYKKSVGFRKGKPCLYRTPDGVAGTALRFQTAEQNYVQSHFVFAFPGKAVTDGPDFTLVDCVVYEEMKPEHQALFEACLQTLKLPSASSR